MTAAKDTTALASVSPIRPDVAPAVTVSVPAIGLSRALTAVLMTASKDTTRPHLCGVLFTRHGECGLRLVSTDGHRLSTVDLPCDAFPGTAQQLDREVLVSSADCKAMLAVLKPAAKSKQNVTLTVAHNPAAMTDALVLTDACSAWKEARYQGMAESFPPYMRLIPSLDSKRKVVPAIGLDCNYVADAAKALATAIPANRNGACGMRVYCSGELEPVVFTRDSPEGTSAMVVVMPMRI